MNYLEIAFKYIAFKKIKRHGRALEDNCSAIIAFFLGKILRFKKKNTFDCRPGDLLFSMKNLL